MNWLKRRSRFKVFLFLDLAAILFNRMEGFEQFTKRVIFRTFLYEYFKIHLLVSEMKSFKYFSIYSPGGHFVHRSGTV